MYSIYDLMFKSPFTMIVAGLSGSGKTVLVRRILSNNEILISKKLPGLKVIWAYGQWQDLYKQKFANVDCVYYDGLPNEDYLKEHKPNKVVIDDLMNELCSDARMGNLFTKGSHHLNINVIFITQNLFQQGSQMRNISLSSHYLIIMKNPRDRSQIDILGRQLKRTKALEQAFNDATRNAYGYLVIYFRQDCPEEIMFRTRITPEETIKGKYSPIVYVSK